MTRKLFLALTILLTLCASADATSVNYGDFGGSPVRYIDVTETANTPDDDVPLYGVPTLLGDMLDFDPAGFSAAANSGSVDLTDGQLNLTLMSDPGLAITSFSLGESGDYTLFGVGSAATQIFYGLTLASITVLEVDGVALGSPVILPPASASGGHDNIGGHGIGIGWDLSIDYNVNAALATANVAFEIGATKLKLAINNTLGAISETSTVAFIAKNDFRIVVEAIPEPTTVLLALIGLLGTALGRGIKLEQF